MHHLIINKLGPIDHCELSLKQYTILTGYQASGKSTIAKAIYFFRTIKDDIYQIIQRNKYSQIIYMQGYAQSNEFEDTASLRGDIESYIRTKFLNIFGSSYSMNPEMQIAYSYNDDTYIKVTLKYGKDSITPNYVWVSYSNNIRTFMSSNADYDNTEILKDQLSKLFNDPYETVYIPAGRSILTVLGSQFSYLYSTMDDAQKRLLDGCTRDYLERVMRLRPQFSGGLEGLLEGIPLSNRDKNTYIYILNLIQNILKGKYAVNDGEERIWVDNNHYVKMNFASSGQQEVVWIVNLLFYYFTLQEKVYFIIEEPESNLFPESQNLVTELIILISNFGNSVLVTTHSPYVLGSINNMLYAGSLAKINSQKVCQIIPKFSWIDPEHFSAFFVKEGGAESCVDEDLIQIDNSLLDEISHTINNTYDALFNVELDNKEE